MFNFLGDYLAAQGYSSSIAKDHNGFSRGPVWCRARRGPGGAASHSISAVMGMRRRPLDEVEAGTQLRDLRDDRRLDCLEA